MIDLDAIKMEALSLEIGETTQVECPQCGKPKLSITRKEDGILYNCWRASCTMAGIVGSVARGESDYVPPAFVPKVFSADTRRISPAFYGAVLRKYDMPLGLYEKQGILQVDSFSETLAMPLFTHLAERWGTTTKSWNRHLKALHYVETEYPMLHFPKGHTNPKDRGIVLVEDVLSAMKVQYFSKVESAALLGTSFDEEKAKILLDAGYRNIILWLDRDAISKALYIKNKFGLFFNQFAILTTDLDPKDIRPDLLNQHVMSMMRG